jgi:hypothetical protein
LSQTPKWHRWDPHLHAPGTILNDQYSGADGSAQFLDRIEASDPPIRALGITDYYSVDVYEMVRAKKGEDRLADVDLIFPNVEMRHGIGTGKGSPINVHLLVSPDDPEHVEHIRRFLRAFTFDAYGESFRCDRGDLIRLGRAHDTILHDDGAAPRPAPTSSRSTRTNCAQNGSAAHGSNRMC